MKKKLIEQIDEKRQNLKILKMYIDKLGYVRNLLLFFQNRSYMIFILD
jgi:hypothetical protein